MKILLLFNKSSRIVHDMDPDEIDPEHWIKFCGSNRSLVMQKNISPCLGSVLEGLAKFAHVINLEFFSDLISVFRDLLSVDFLSHREQVKYLRKYHKKMYSPKIDFFMINEKPCGERQEKHSLILFSFQILFGKNLQNFNKAFLDY